MKKRLVWKLWFILSVCTLLYLGTFSDDINSKCQLETVSVSLRLTLCDTRKSGIDNSYRIQCFFGYKPRGASPGLGWYYHWYVQIYTGNKLWGPLNRKKGGMLRRLRIYHRQRNKSSASQITLVIIKYQSSKEVRNVLYIELECM